MGGLNASYCRDLSPVPPTREGYGRAYPDQVSRHNLVCLLLRFLVPVPVRDIWAMTVVVVSLVDTRPPRTSPVGSESESPGECHGSRSVSSECRWSTRMGGRGHGFRGVGTVCCLCRVYKVYR